MEKKKKKVWKEWVYWFLFAVASIFVYKTLDNLTDITNWIKNLLSVLMPFLMGILVAYLFYIPCRKIEKLYNKPKLKLLHKKARVLSIFTVYIIVILIIVLAINFVIPVVAQSLIDLTNNIGGYYDITMENLENIPEDSILNAINIKEIVEDLKNIDLKQFFNMEKLSEYAKGVMNLAIGIFDVFVTLVVSIYILIERKEILEFFRKLAKAILKEDTYKNIGKYFYKTNNIFFRFLSSQILDAFVVGVLTAVVMSILGVKYAILLGFLIGISNLIPYFGAIVGVGVSILITVFTGGFGKAIWMGIVVIILQQIDANIINPKITGNSLKISPLLVIFAVTLGGAYFGVLGMFLAVPIITVIKILLQDYIEYRTKSE